MDNLSSAITLVTHSIRYPDPHMPNHPSFFGISPEEENHKIRTLGRMKLFPEQVQKTVFGENKEDSPLIQLALIRGRLQAFIDCYTFPFANGLANALPDAKLPAFAALVQKWQGEFTEAKSKYLSYYEELQEASVDFWRTQNHLYQISALQMEEAIRESFVSEDRFEKRFLFQTIHFEVTNPGTMSTEGARTSDQVAIIEARNKVAQEAGQKLSEARDQFIQDAVTEMRQRAVDAFSTLRANITEGKWNQKSLNAVMKFMDSFKDLNFFSDTELEAFIEEQRSEFISVTASDIKKDEDLQSAFAKTLDDAIGQLKELAEADKQEIVNRFSNLGSTNRKVEVDDEF